jgi:hypothetical protein
MDMMTEDGPMGQTRSPLQVADGLGVDSMAMLIGLRDRGVVPDAILFADTRSEKGETYAYLPVVTDWCRRAGFPEPVVVEYRVKDFKNWPPYRGLEENCLTNGTLPSEAFGMGSCSEKWKQQPQNNWTKSWAPAVEAWALGGKVRKAIGYDDSSADKKRSCSADRTFKASPDARYDYWYPLQEWKIDRKKCVEMIVAEQLPGWDPIYLAGGPLVWIERGGIPVKSSCFFCLDGDEQVVTPGGNRPIRELVGRPTLLIPNKQSCFGVWREVEVKAFGVQPLLRIELKRGPTRKSIHATAEHRWVVRKQDDQCWQKFVTTEALKAGDKLPTCRAVSVKSSRSKVLPSPFGIAQGFVFGDGGVPSRKHAPAVVVLHGRKSPALLKYFGLCSHRAAMAAGKKTVYVYGLPRAWKDLPPLDESKGFLLGWLAGYFAADGTVGKNGAATLCSSVESHVEFARTVCTLLGVQTSPPTKRTRVGFGKATVLHQITIHATDLPEEFWIMPHHRARAAHAREDYGNRFRDWKVVSVSATGRSAPVFCAVVPGVEMFTLADGIVTGNCPNMKAPEVAALPKDKLGRVVIMEARAKVRLEGHMTQDQLDAKYEKQLAGWIKKSQEARSKGLELPRAPKRKTAGAKQLMRGLWRNRMMTDFIRQEGLLSGETIDRLSGMVPTELVRRNEAHARGDVVESWEEFMGRVLVNLS